MNKFFNKMSGTKRGKFFYKLFIGYLIAMAVPILFFFILNTEYFIRTYESEIENNISSSLEKNRENFDAYLKNINSIPQEISYDYRYNTYYLENIMNRRLVMEELQQYRVSNFLIKNILVYFPRTGMFISPNSTYSIDTFFDIYSYENLSRETFSKKINETQDSSYIPIQSVTELGGIYPLLTLIYKIDSETYCIFLIDSNKLTDLLSTTRTLYPINTSVVNEEGIIIFSTSSESFISNELSPIDDYANSDTVNIGQTDYILFKEKSSSTKWFLVSLVPEKLAYLPVYRMKLINTISIILVLFIGAALTVFLSIRNYNPIIKLRQNAYKFEGSGSFANDEFANVTEAISKLGNQVQKLTDINLSRKSAYKDYLLQQLIKGNIRDISDFDEIMEEFELNLKENLYYISIVQLENVTNRSEDLKIKQVIQLAKSIFSRHINSYCVTDFDNRTVIFLLYEDVSLKTDLQNCLTQVQSSIRLKKNVQCTISISNAYNNISLTGKAYMEALSALDYKLVKGYGSIIFFDETIANNSNNSMYPSELISEIQKSINIGKINQINDALSELTSYIIDNNLSLALTRCVCYEIVLIFLGLERRMGIRLDSPSTQKIANFSTVNELLDLVRNFTSDIYSQFAIKNIESQKELALKANEIINSNFKDINFSVSTIADKMNMNSSTLSQIYKKTTGLRLVDKLKFTRIECAKKLLLDTEMQINDIVREIGYIDSSSFIKTFKKQTGITPGIWRSKFSHFK